MNVLTVCSGIGAPEVAWRGFGWNYIAGADIEAFPNAVRAHHFPEVPNWGDMTKFQEWPDADIDLLVGGTPCQSFSVAGLRKGLADPRGNLALTFLAIAAKYAPRWILWENVPGVLSSEQGRDFGAFLGGLGQCGYGWAYRVLDAQHFGVPQRRRRVFVVGHLGDWRRAAAVLFERHSLQGNPPPRREARASVAALTANGVGTCGADDNQGQAEHLIPQGCGGETAPTLNAAFGSKLGLDNQHIDSGAGLFVAHSLRAEGFDASEDGTGRGTPLVPVTCGTLTSNGDAHSGFKDENGLVAFGWQNSPSQGASASASASASITPTLDKSKTPAVAFMENQRAELRISDQTDAMATGGGKPGQGYPAALQGSAVRRLTPRECERLQGFPDDYTLIPYRGKPAADGPRYKALGNSMAVPVMRWIGERIAMVEALQSQSLAA
jgi:DNA (cytosine-5)-methyltransferase 1